MLEKAIVGGLLIICFDKYIQQCYSIIANISIDYKKQVMIIGIKLEMQYFIYQVPHKKRENLCKTLALEIYENMWA